jgi:transcriptional regulator with XRE-family HTH domain
MAGKPPPELALRFGRNVALYRQLQRFSQEVVAERGEIHRTQMTLFETGQRLPRLDTVIKLASALNLTLPELLEGIRWQQPTVGSPGRWVISDKLTVTDSLENFMGRPRPTGESNA